MRGPRRVQQGVSKQRYCASEPTTVSYPLCHNLKNTGRQENHLSNTFCPSHAAFSCDGSLTARAHRSSFAGPPLLSRPHLCLADHWHCKCGVPVTMSRAPEVVSTPGLSLTLPCSPAGLASPHCAPRSSAAKN